MPSRLERRLFLLEGKPRVYRSAAEMPDEVLLALIGWRGQTPPTDEELRAFAAGQFKAEGNNHAEP